VPALGRGFTSNGRDSTVTIFDLRTLAVLGTVHIPGANPDAILFDPVSSRVFSFNGGSHSFTAIDPASGSVLGTVDLGGKPEFAVSDGEGGIYVNLEDKSSLVRFDGRSLALRETWSLAPCESPTGLAIDRRHHRLFAGCDKLMVVFDPEHGRVVATAPIGDGVDGTGFDAARQLAFSSNGEGTLSIVREESPDDFVTVATVPTQRGARTMTLDERTGRVFTVTAEYGPPPAPTAERPRPRPSIVPGTFTLLVIGS
jgi:DNA-binding beta-propeller fold protein YncE